MRYVHTSRPGGSELPGLDQLLVLDNEDFVRAAYARLLGRDPDPEGLRFYAAELLRGVDKLDLLERLSLSDEARLRGTGRLEGLREAIDQRRHQAGKWQRAVRQLSGAHYDAIARQIRGIDQTLRRTTQRVDSETAEIKEALAEIRSHIRLIAETVSDEQASDLSDDMMRARRSTVSEISLAHEVVKMRTFLGDF
jgi:methyl-accepting chemotaxis protein